MSHDHAAHGHGGAHGAGQGGYTHAGHGYGGAPKGYAVQHSAADGNRRGREEGETLHYALYTVSHAPAHARQRLTPTRLVPNSRRLLSSWPPRV